MVCGKPIASTATSTPCPSVSWANPLNEVIRRRVDHVVCAETLGLVELSVGDVRGDDPSGADQPGTLNGVEAHTAAADDQHGVGRSNSSGVHHSADSGGDGAAHQRRLLERRVGPNRACTRLGRHRVGPKVPSPAKL